ncbi:MAG: MBL fold metallo-hydrolase [Bacteroidales bacterium]|nr:MBL fold metallo-hydrolase [Bacteroidales bacterium]
MRVITLIENLVYQKDLFAEHGLSFYIEGLHQKILFDTGQTDSFIHNAAVLGIDLTAIDAVVISHGHYDHTGGLYSFLKINKKAKVFIKKEAFQPKYHGPEKFIGVAYDQLLDKRIEYVQEKTEIDDGIFIMPDIPVRFPEDTHCRNFQVKINDKLVDDSFEDELYLAITQNRQLSVISSCSHRGIINIMVAARAHFPMPVDTILGGFHIRASLDNQLETLVKYFIEISPEAIGVCHCSGVEKFAWLQRHLGNKVFYNHTGKAVEVNT